MAPGTRRCAKLIGARTSLHKHSLVDWIGLTQKLACRVKPGRDPPLSDTYPGSAEQT